MKKIVSFALMLTLVFMCSCAVSKGPLADPAHSKVNYENTSKKATGEKTTAAAENAVQVFVKGWGMVESNSKSENGESVSYTFLDFDGDGVPELIASTPSKNHYFKADIRAGQVLYIENDAESEYVPSWTSSTNKVRLLKNLETQQNFYYVSDEKNGNEVAYTDYFLLVGFEGGKFSCTPAFKINHGLDNGKDTVTDYFAFQDWGFEPIGKESYDEKVKRMERDYTEIELGYASFSSTDFDSENLDELTKVVKASFEAFKMG